MRITTGNIPQRIYRKVQIVLRDIARKKLRKQVAFTPPSPPANKDISFSPHALACHRDILLTVSSCKALNLAASTPLPWIFHDDGSLTPNDCRLLKHQFPGCRVILRTESDAAYASSFTRYKQLTLLRRRHLMLLKLADLFVYSSRERILYCDSDILFFKRPTFLLSCLEGSGQVNYFNKDIATCYVASPSVVRKLTGVEPPERINAGLSVLNRPDISLDKIDAVLSSLDARRYDAWSYYNHLIEQTAVAVLTAASGNGCQHLPEEYDVRFDSPLAQVTTRHYVGKIRHQYELEGLRYLINNVSFLERWSDFTQSR